MTTTTRTPETRSVRRTQMDPLRRTALIVGLLFVITYITSIAAKFGFYPPLAAVCDALSFLVAFAATAIVILVPATLDTLRLLTPAAPVRR